MVAAKICDNCRRYPCIKNLPLNRKDSCAYPMDFEYKDNLVWRQDMLFSFDLTDGRAVDRTFKMYVAKNGQPSWWLEDDEGNMVVSEKELGRNWYKSSRQIDGIVKTSTKLLIGKALHSELYNNVNPGYVRDSIYLYISELCEKISKESSVKDIGFDSQNKETKNNVFTMQRATRLSDNRLAELIYDREEDKARIILWNGKQTQIVDEVKDNNITYTPPKDAAPFKKGVIVLPGSATDYGNISKLIDEIKTFLQKYLDIPEREYEICAYAILFSWLQDNFTTTPYLRAIGDFGCGKSRFLDCVGRLCYRATVSAGSVTPAVIFRIAEQWKGTLILDEGDFKYSDMYSDLIKILNCRYEIGRPVIRCNKDNPNELEMFDIYGMTVLSSRGVFRDAALESRFYTLVMQETAREDMPVNLSPEFFEEQQGLINKLMMFRLRNYGNVRSVNGDLLLGLEPRIRQIMSPLLSIVDDRDAKERITGLVKEHYQELINERLDTLEGQIILVITEIMKELGGVVEVTSKDVSEKLIQHGLETSTSVIGKKLKSLGFKSKRKHEGKRVWEIDEKVIERCKHRYLGRFNQNLDVSPQTGEVPESPVTAVSLSPPGSIKEGDGKGDRKNRGDIDGKGDRGDRKDSKTGVPVPCVREKLSQHDKLLLTYHILCEEYKIYKKSGYVHMATVLMELEKLGFTVEGGKKLIAHLKEDNFIIEVKESCYRPVRGVIELSGYLENYLKEKGVVYGD